MVTELEKQMAAALRRVLPYMTAAENRGLTGDEGCHWPVEEVRTALAAYDHKAWEQKAAY
jgi:hypothetical protein